MATTKARSKSRATTNKKPKWGVVSYKKIEARRIELGYSKSAMAEALGVTNSTYHNWRRGTTVPHPNQQEQIRDAMAEMQHGASPKQTAIPSRTDRKTRGDVGGGSHAKHHSVESHPLYPNNVQSVREIAQITAAYISVHNKAPSAGSVYDFVKGLRKALNEGE